LQTRGREGPTIEEAKKGRFSVHFWNGARYHYGPRNKNHRIYWGRTLVEDPLDMWEQGRRLTGHPGLPLEPTPNLGAAD
jgi:hypothetical protein